MACIKGCGRLKQSQGGPPMVCVEARRPLLGGLVGGRESQLALGSLAAAEEPWLVGPKAPQSRGDRWDCTSVGTTGHDVVRDLGWRWAVSQQTSDPRL